MRARTSSKLSISVSQAISLLDSSSKRLLKKESARSAFEGLDAPGSDGIDWMSGVSRRDSVVVERSGNLVGGEAWRGRGFGCT